MRPIGFVALLAYILAAVCGAGIMCFGADGHVAFEQLRDDHPLVNDSTVISMSHAVVEALVARDGPPGMPHGPCFDLALDASSQWQAGAKAEPPRVSAPPSSPTAGAAGAPVLAADTPHHRVAFAEPASDPVLIPLRSTVLRI